MCSAWQWNFALCRFSTAFGNWLPTAGRDCCCPIYHNSGGSSQGSLSLQKFQHCFQHFPLHTEFGLLAACPALPFFFKGTFAPCTWVMHELGIICAAWKPVACLCHAKIAYHGGTGMGEEAQGNAPLQDGSAKGHQALPSST